MIKQKTNLKQTRALRKKQPKPKTKSNLLIKPFNRNKRNRPSKNQKKKRTKTKTKYNKKTQKLQKCLRRENNMMKKWTPKDEKLLLQLVRTEKFCDWDFVSSHFEEFEPKHCFKRYRQLKKIESIKGAWNSIEDELLKKAIVEFGERNWAYVSNFVPARSSKQCRERWKNQLRPGINHTPFTSFEERLLIEKQREFGNKWSQISKYFNGRPDNMLKNIYHSICTRRGINCQNRFDEKKKCKKKKFKKKIIVIGKKRTVVNTNHVPLDMKGRIKKEMEGRKLKSTNLAGIFFPNTPQKKYKVKKGSTKKHLKIKPYKKNKKKKLNNNLEKKKSKQNEKKKEKENKKKKEKGKEKNIDSLKHNKEMIKFQKYHINNQKTPNKNDYHLQYGQRTNKDTTRLENHNKKLQQEKHYELSRSDSENDININSNSKKKINQYYQKNPKIEIDKIKNKLKDKKIISLKKLNEVSKKKKKIILRKEKKSKQKGSQNIKN
ncbi:snRNA-activating protein complex subunit 4 [Anaeramoeba flamelloides]|uniref:snRNA-activating protein complex subunit 4 n=1 Tax=Anaeramoeba flamelloides TaxID=1746091 RepID=A0ABQ8Z463_9EUKA|nr:snRNA-activating protein complex subunit 4 [Anaeramoeba flamelloides]